MSHVSDISPQENMKDFLEKCGVPMERGKISIPEGLKHVKLDIGLSYSAPQSRLWLEREKDLVIFGFEPNPDSLTALKFGGVKRHPAHGEPLDPNCIGKTFFLVPCALSQNHGTMPIYCTANCSMCDLGSTSLYAPRNFPVEKVVEIPCFRLDSFLSLFPFDTHPVIEYVKIDAQGSDLDIIKSGGKYISENVAVITVEPENFQYFGTDNSEQSIDSYMGSIGFEKITNHQNGNYAADPTYINSKFIHMLPAIQYYQMG